MPLHEMNSIRELVEDFAEGMKAADAKAPVAVNVRSKEAFRPGIGPHSEARTVELVADQMRALHAARYSGRVSTSVPYPDITRQKCDLCVGAAPNWDWAIEVKMLRMLGDNGKLNDNILMHILSPYPEHRSALTDCEKLVASALPGRKGIIIYGYDHPEWPLVPAIEAFERLASARVVLGDRVTASFHGLVHPVHSYGAVYGWPLEGSPAHV
jgi:hypothetical protein